MIQIEKLQQKMNSACCHLIMIFLPAFLQNNFSHDMANQDAILCHQTETKPMSHEFHVWSHLSCNFGFEPATTLSLILKISTAGVFDKNDNDAIFTKKLQWLKHISHSTPKNHLHR